MQLQRKYINQREYETNQYLEDPQFQEDNTLEKIITIGAIAALGYSAIKSGALRPIIEKGLKTVVDNYDIDLRAVKKGINSWLNADHLVEAMDSKIEASIFRQNNIKELLNNIGKYNFSTIYKSSLNDLNKLRPQINENLKKAKETLNTSDLEIVKNINEIMNTLNIVQQIKNNSDEINLSNNDKNLLMEQLFNNIDSMTKQQYKTTLSDIHKHTIKSAQESLKRKGFRYLVLEDILEQTKDIATDFTNKWQKVENTNPSFAKAFKNQKDLIDAFLLNKQAAGFSFSDIKRFRIDSNILVNENFTEILDMRKINNDLNTALQTAVFDFQIPILNIRPLEWLGIDKYAKNKVNFTVLTGRQDFLASATGKNLTKKPFIYMNGNVIDSATGSIVESNIVLKDAGNKEISGDKIVIDKARKLMGIDTNNIHRKYNVEKDGYIKGGFRFVADKLDIGYQDTQLDNFKLFSPNTWLTTIFKPLFKHLRPAEFGDRDSLNEVFNFSEVMENQINYIGVKKSTTIGNVISRKSNKDIYDFVGQFFAGRRGNIEKKIDAKWGETLRNSTNIGLQKIGLHLQDDNLHDVSAIGLKGYAITETLSSYFASFGFGASVKNVGSVQSILSGLLLKRFLPIYMGFKVWDYLNYESENATGHRPQNMIADAKVNADLAWHSIKDQIGLTAKAKRAAKLIPGFEQISQIPALGFLDMSQTREEKERYHKSGMEPIRKGRFWELGNTPYSGGKVQYYIPSSYRRTKANWKFTDTLYGSEDEYYQNTWFPTPRYPLAPIKHFVTDRYHYEDKHYKDRPYMVSSTIGEEIPFIGPIFGSTIGRLLKPPKKMHLEYWQDLNEKDQEDQTIVYVPERGFLATPENILSNEIGIVSPKTKRGKLLVKSDFEEETEKDYAVLTTPSGQNNIYASDTPFDIEKLNKQIKFRSLTKTKPDSTKLRDPFSENFFQSEFKSYPANTIKTKTPYGIENTTSLMHKQLADMFGMHGFVASSIVEDPTLKKRTIESSTNLDSFKRGFWDRELGGYGGELSEIFRRFIPKRRYEDKQYNPIRNTMPKWMPGEDYFINFKIGDPYSKIRMGEIRLPGAAYEKIHNIEDPTIMSIGSSSIGKSKSDIIRHLMNEDDTFDERIMRILDKGTQAHKKIEEDWIQRGLAIKTEGFIQDKKYKIKGWYDALVRDESSPTGRAIVDVKTANRRRLNEVIRSGKGFDDNVAQVNWYLHETGEKVGYLTYVLRSHEKSDEKPILDKEGKPINEITMRFTYDHKLYKDTINKLESARAEIRSKLDTGEINRGDLYSYFDRFKILADVAPYSNEYRYYKTMMANVPLEGEQKEEYKRILEQVKEQKTPLRLYDYRFKHADIQKKNVTITKIIDADTFLTKEFRNTPIRLAGLTINKEHEDRMKQLFFQGARVTIGIDKDPLKVKNKDTYGSISAVVYKGNKNINKMLLEEGIAKEKENDYSPTSVHARFTPSEIKIGGFLERFSHTDTMFHTKFLQVRSPLESYKRRHLYGKDFQQWQNPIKDYLKPAYDNFTSKNLVAGILMGAFVGTMFGRTKFGKISGAMISGSVVVFNQSKKMIHETTKREKWIPERRQKEREINEYIDMLKYIKAQKLYNYYADLALKKERFDVRKYIKQHEQEGEKRKAIRNKLKRDKKRIKFGGQNEVVKMARFEGRRSLRTGPLGIFVVPQKDAMKRLNKSKNIISNYRQIDQLPENAMKALAYYQQSKQTLYAYEKGDSIQNVLAALPRTERLYFNEFINAPQKEREEILKLVPKYMRRPLESVWNLPVEEKTNITEYFKRHQLPDKNWIGWQEHIDLESVKVKIVKTDKSLSESDFDIWQEDVDIASMQEIPVPHISYHTKANDVTRRLTELLSKEGYTDIVVNTLPSHKDSLDINLKFDQYLKIEKYIEQQRYKIFE